MSQYRVAALLGPVLVLYLVAQGAAAGGVVDVATLVIIVLASAVSLGAWFVLRPDALSGARRVALLSASSAIAVTAHLWPEQHSLLAELLAAVAVPAGASALLSLSASVPDVPSVLARRLWVVRLASLAVLGTAALGLVAVLPPARVLGSVVLMPAWALHAPYAGGLFALSCATALRLSRRRLGSDARSLAANLWAALGCLFALGAASILAVVPLRPGSGWLPGLWALIAVSLAGGHLWLVDARRALVAGPLGRGVLATTLTLGTVAAVAGFSPISVPPGTFARSLLVVGALLGAYGLRALFGRAVRLAFAPERGRLLDAVEEIEADLARGDGFDDLAARVLRPLRRAVGSPEAAPALYTLNPSEVVRLDAAGQAHRSARSLPPPIEQRLSENPRGTLLLDELERLLVRRPEHRELVAVLRELGACAVVPLSREDELEGALVVAKGRREAPLTLEELSALDALCDRLTPFVSAHAATQRAHARAHEALRQKAGLEERIESLEDEVAALRADARTYAGANAVLLRDRPVAYSPAMRALSKQLTDMAPHDVSLLLVAEAGSKVEALAEQVHEQSGRSEGPLVVGACAHTPPEQLEAALFGRVEGPVRDPGWLRLSGGGTLLLLDVPAMPLRLQQQLAEALADRQARPTDGTGAYPVSARVIATSRKPLAQLREQGLVHDLLAQRLETAELRVPPLRERTEDLQSQVLMAIDRAARVLGREPVGIEPAALEVLAQHDWPLNLVELDSVIERAVGSAEATQIRVVDLPELTGGARDPAYDAPFAEQERLILERALSAAGGNRSVAAKRLGLSRAVLLEKLRRHGFDEDPASQQESN